jgi:hypothetical protein
MNVPVPCLSALLLEEHHPTDRFHLLGLSHFLSAPNYDSASL